MSTGLDILGADPITVKHTLSWKRTTLAVASGVLGAVLVPRHPVLAFLGAAAAASNVHAVANGERPWKAAVKRMGRHVVATVGSLSVPVHPALGYVAGAIAADLLIDDEGGGIIEEWASYEGVRDPNVIDAEFVETSNSKALVKR